MSGRDPRIERALAELDDLAETLGIELRRADRLRREAEGQAALLFAALHHLMDALGNPPDYAFADIAVWNDAGYALDMHRRHKAEAAPR